MVSCSFKMSVDVAEAQCSENFLAASGTSHDMFVLIYPHVIVKVSDNWTRVKEREGRPLQVIGVLAGKRVGRIIEIMNSFELQYDKIDDDFVIDKDYYCDQEEKFKQLFSELDFIGWYTTGGCVNKSDINVHQQICELNESPVFLKLNPDNWHAEPPFSLNKSVINLDTGETLFSLYKSVINLDAGEATVSFVELPYTLASEEAEKIGFDHMLRMFTSDIVDTSKVVAQLQAQRNAIKVLYSRLTLLLKYVRAVKEGKVTANAEVLREAYSLCQRLPTIAIETAKEGDFTENSS